MNKTKELNLLIEACGMHRIRAAKVGNVDYDTMRQWTCGARTGPIEKFDEALSRLTKISKYIESLDNA